MDRLDSVLGPENWSDHYRVIDAGETVVLSRPGEPSKDRDERQRTYRQLSVVCRLSIRVGGEWLSRMDIGSTSEQDDAGDRMKAAFSDAMKRVGVKYGIGRYLYKFPLQWLPWDLQKKQFKKDPSIPPWAMPGQKQQTGGRPSGGTSGGAPANNGRPAQANNGKPGPAAGQSWQEWARSMNNARAEKIGPQAATKIVDHLKKNGRSVDGFLEYFDITFVGALPSVCLDHAWELLNKRAAPAKAQ